MMSVMAAIPTSCPTGFTLSNTVFYSLLLLEEHEGLKRLLMYEMFPGIMSFTYKLPF